MVSYDAFESRQMIPQGESLEYRSLADITRRLSTMMIQAKQEGKPLVMALDGMPGLGKTTFANALASALKEKGKEVEIKHVDDFLAKKAVRYAWKRAPRISPAANYNARNVRHDKLIDEVLEPIARDGELHSDERKAYHFGNDDDTEPRVDNVGIDTFVIVEGAMAVRDISTKYYDLAVHLGGLQSLAVEQAFFRNADPDSDKLPKSEEEMLESVKRYLDGYGQHVAEHGTLASDIVVVARKNPDSRVHDVQYAFQSVTPLEKISKGNR